MIDSELLAGMEQKCLGFLCHYLLAYLIYITQFVEGTIRNAALIIDPTSALILDINLPVHPLFCL